MEMRDLALDLLPSSHICDLHHSATLEGTLKEA